MMTVSFAPQALNSIRKMPAERRKQVGFRLWQVQQEELNSTWAKALAVSEDLYLIRIAPDLRLLLALQDGRAVVLDVASYSERLLQKISEVIKEYGSEGELDRIAKEVSTSDKPADALQETAPQLIDRLKEALAPQDAGDWRNSNDSHCIGRNE